MSDKIIRFPGPGRTPPSASATPDAPPVVGPDGLNEDQRKAIQLVMSGMTFVLIGLKPSDKGADFFTALHGDHGDLRNAHPHLGGVIDRLYARKGVHVS
jgi:hypothetical protein